MSPVRFCQRLVRLFRRRQTSPSPSEPALLSGSRGAGDLNEALQSAVDRLLEDEALTADLVDAAARRLLDWGIAQVTATLQETGALSEEAQARLVALRRRMRDVARQVGQLPPEEQAAALQRWLDTLGPPSGKPE